MTRGVSTGGCAALPHRANPRKRSKGRIQVWRPATSWRLVELNQPDRVAETRRVDGRFDLSECDTARDCLLAARRTELLFGVVQVEQDRALRDSQCPGEVLRALAVRGKTQ